MKTFIKDLLFFLSMVYTAQFIVCILSNESDKWSIWFSVEFHLGLWVACLIMSLAHWAYKRIKNSNRNNG